MRRAARTRLVVAALVIATSSAVAVLLDGNQLVATRATGSGEIAEPDARIQSLFSASVSALRLGDHERAESTLRSLVTLAPWMPEAHVNHGYALLYLKRAGPARDAFMRALELRPRQANAFYGLGVAEDALGNRAGALGAMRSYVHLAPPEEPHVRKARAAIWEWQSLSGPVSIRIPRDDGSD